MSLITVIAAPIQNGQSDEHVPLAREVHLLATSAEGQVLDFDCLNQLIIDSSE